MLRPLRKMMHTACIMTFAVITIAIALATPPILTTAWADTEHNKALVVDCNAEEINGETYKTVQDAINYIDNQNDKENWIITLNSGEYERFTVLNDMNGLVVKAAEGANVTIDVCNGSKAPAATPGRFPDTAGVSIRQANNVTFDGLTFNVGSQNSPWYSAAVSNYSESSIKSDNFTVRNCTIEGTAATIGIGVFVNTGTTQFTVENCSISNVKEAISMYGDGTLMKKASVVNNNFANCSFALHGYYGGTGDAGVLTFADNTVTGSAELRCKIVIQDQTNTGALRTDVRENTFTNTVVGLVNLREDGEIISPVLASNMFRAGSFYVEAVEPGTIDFYTSYQAPASGNQSALGYWSLTGAEDFDVDWGKNPDGSTAVIEELVALANATALKQLNITGIDPDNLIKTFTYFKDGIYWNSFDTSAGLTISKTVEGTAANKEQEFNFQIELGDKTINGTFGDLTFENGVAKFTLCSGESVTAKGLPTEYLQYTYDNEGNTVAQNIVPLDYIVTELDSWGYEVSSTNAEGKLTADTTTEVSFVNTKNEDAATTEVSFVNTKNEDAATTEVSFANTKNEDAATTCSDDTTAQDNKGCETQIQSDKSSLAQTNDPVNILILLAATMVIVGCVACIVAWRKSYR